ncbi:uncharacterized protein Tco025E_00957 [Trypanosoma conorhini]|uniref:Uncharacterized protein n=1 Tax=Trypanosoma conorhini TaxID=83891 RepID=A0A422QA17_9TRYP|nr:uncharacterized protein Tco025E_00957 [Trypanosoma conorhini]RNF26801.1 hypothetical protein Tco025E_00957 [Trypanosoma conorhini]
MPPRNGVAGHAGVAAAPTRSGTRASSAGAVAVGGAAARLRKPARKKTQRRPSTSPAPAPRPGAQPPGERYSPPRLLHAQDLRGEANAQARLQTTLSPRMRMSVYPAGRRAASGGALHEDNIYGNKSSSPPLSTSRTQSAGFLPSSEPSTPSNYEDPSRELSEAGAAQRPVGPLVTEEWARSIVQPQDEYLLYERQTAGIRKREERVRLMQGVWLRERARAAAGPNEGLAAALRPAEAAVPVTSNARQRSLSQQQPRNSPSLESLILDSEELERERTVWMNERQIRARGTPLLFTRPRQQTFGSDRNPYGGWQKSRGAVASSDPTAPTAYGVGGDATALPPQRRNLGDNIMVASILQPGFTNSERSMFTAAGAPSASAPSTHKQPAFPAAAPVSLPQRSAGETSGAERTPSQAAASGGLPPVSSSTLLFFDTAAPDVARLFDNPLFLLRGDENHERLLLAQAEHEARGLLLKLHTTSVQSGHSLLSPGPSRGEEPKARYTQEVYLGVGPPRRRVAPTPVARPAGGAAGAGHVAADNHTAFSAAAGVGAAPRPSAFIAAAWRQEKLRSDAQARYVLLDTPSQQNPAPAAGASEMPLCPRDNSEEGPVEHHSRVEVPAKSKARHREAVASLSTRKKQQEKTAAHKHKRKASTSPSPTPHRGGERLRREKAAANSPSPSPEPLPTPTPTPPPPPLPQPRQEEVVAVAAEKQQHLPEPREQLQPQPQGTTPHLNGSPVASPVKRCRPPGAASPPAKANGAEGGRPREAVCAWDIAYPSTESMSRSPSASSSPVHHLEEAIVKPSTELETSGASRRIGMNTAALGGRGGASPTKHQKRMQQEAVSIVAAAEFSYREGEPDAELKEYVQFALRQEGTQVNAGKGAEEDIMGLPGVAWLKRHQRRLTKAEANTPSVPNGAAPATPGAEKEIVSVNVDDMLDNSDDMLDNSDDGASQWLEELGHYTRNVNAVLAAFGSLWQVPFQDAEKRETLPLVARAQLLFFDSRPPAAKMAAAAVAEKANEKNTCSTNHNGEASSIDVK